MWGLSRGSGAPMRHRPGCGPRPAELLTELKIQAVMMWRRGWKPISSCKYLNLWKFLAPLLRPIPLSIPLKMPALRGLWWLFSPMLRGILAVGAEVA
jgi:hypothetical protein